MLVLSRTIGEQIVIGNKVTVVVSRVAGNRVMLGIQAPADVHIVRGELPPVAEDSQGKSTKSNPRSIRRLAPR